MALVWSNETEDVFVASHLDDCPRYAGSTEVIDAIEDWDLGFHSGNVVKYVARAKHKGGELEDLRKARWYLDRLIALKENDE